MAEIKLQADDTRIATIKFEDGAGANKDVTIPKAGGLLNVLTQGTAVTATGTAIDFTGIPSTAKRITVMFDGLSTNGTTLYLLQLGHSGGIEAAGYKSRGSTILGTNTTSIAAATGGFQLVLSGGAGNDWVGKAVILNVSGNIWELTGSAAIANGITTFQNGSKTLSDTLDRIRITTANGTDAFDAGTINIMWE